MDREVAVRALEEELERGLSGVRRASTVEDLERAQVAVLGRKSRYGQIQKSLGGLSPEDRRTVGKRANEVRAALEQAFRERRMELEEHEQEARLRSDRVDVTLPGRRPRLGALHPLTIVERQVVEVFTRMGYRVVQGPEVETDWYNFTALNIPPNHP